jgi:hypothetical protein
LCMLSALDIRAIYEHDGATRPPRVEGDTTPSPAREAASAFSAGAYLALIYALSAVN